MSEKALKKYNQVAITLMLRSGKQKTTSQKLGPKYKMVATARRVHSDKGRCRRKHQQELQKVETEVESSWWHCYLQMNFFFFLFNFMSRPHRHLFLSVASVCGRLCWM